MDLVEQLRDHLAYAIEFNLALPGEKNRDEWARRVHQAINLYRALTYEQALAMGRILLATYDMCLQMERTQQLRTFLTTVPIEHLHYLAVLQPAAMRELYPEVIECDGLLWHGEIFCAGEAQARDALLARLAWSEIEPGVIEDTIELSSSLKCLAWIGDDHVVAKFTEWQNLTLRWLPNAAQLARDPSIAGDSSTRPLTNTTREAGWELTSDGRRRDLYVPHWRKLILARSPGAQSTPVSVGGLMEALCPWCERDLAAIFDLDLRAPELAFLGLTGERLRIPVCRWCSYGGGNGPLFWREDTSGNARWSEANGERPAQGAQYDTSREYEPPWSVVQYILGPEHADPYTSLVPEGDFDPNRLGGLPAWVQYPDHPICIDCGRSLRFLGQLDADEHGGWEGLIYVFLCAECQVAATLHQQT